MENIIIKIIDLCNSNGLDYQIETTGVGYENQFLIWDNQDRELSLYFDEESDNTYPNVVSWTEYGSVYETEQFEVIEKIIKNNFVEIN